MLAYQVLFAGGLLIVISYFFNEFSRKSQVPSVFLLIVFGILLKVGFDSFETDGTVKKLINYLTDKRSMNLLGQLGTILIVLEGALELKLTREKMLVVKSALASAIFVMLLSATLIAIPLVVVFENGIIQSLIYGTVLSVASSAVLIPSIKGLVANRREFLIYEASFSDILGIMLFNFLVGLTEGGSTQEAVFTNIGGLVIVVLLSFVITLALIYFLSVTRTKVKVFLVLGVLASAYAAGKLFHLSPLLLVFLFGLTLNNPEWVVFILKERLHMDRLKTVVADFKMLTIETAFIVRTFFFVVFGLSLNVSMLNNTEVLLAGVIITILLYFARFVYLRFFRKEAVLPDLFLNPRGLITVLLFYTIPEKLEIDLFNQGVLVFVVLVSIIIMMITLILTKTKPSATINVGLGESSHHE